MKKYLEIFAEIQRLIENQTYPKGSLLPSENLLANRYQTSRETIRKALKELEVAGYIQKHQGKGSIVLDKIRYPFPVGSLTSFHEIEVSEHLEAKTIVLVIERVKAPPFLVEEGLVPEGQEMILVVRQRWIDGFPQILDKDYLRADLVQEITPVIAEKSLYAFLEEKLGLKISYAQKEFVGERVTKEDKDYLYIRKDSHVMVVRSKVYLEDTTFFQYTESRHCLDKFGFVEFARRGKTV